MPVMTGLELIEQLRQHEETKDTPVVMLPARSFAVPQEQQDHLRISGCLRKPFRPTEKLGQRISGFGVNFAVCDAEGKITLLREGGGFKSSEDQLVQWTRQALEE